MQYVILQSPLSSCQNVTVNLCCVGIHLFSFLSPLTFPSSPLFCFFVNMSSSLSSLYSLPLPPSDFSHHPLSLFFHPLNLFALLQSLSTPQAQALSCVESLCCYQHGQSGCTRLASFLEQMTGQCQAGPNHCHMSSCNNRWGGRQQQQQTMIMNPDEPSPPLGFKKSGLQS